MPCTDGIGMLEILGREDTQVKVNGYRIELGEIEKIAMEDERVVNCCAVVSEVRSTPQLVLFVTCNGSIPYNNLHQAVREQLVIYFAESLPSYMVLKQ